MKPIPTDVKRYSFGLHVTFSTLLENKYSVKLPLVEEVNKIVDKIEVKLYDVFGESTRLEPKIFDLPHDMPEDNPNRIQTSVINGRVSPIEHTQISYHAQVGVYLKDSDHIHYTLTHNGISQLRSEITDIIDLVRAEIHFVETSEYPTFLLDMRILNVLEKNLERFDGTHRNI